MGCKNCEKLEEEKDYYKSIIQDVLKWGRIYHFQKKRLCALGFEVYNTHIEKRYSPKI
jgi:hypothetical protein